MRLSVRRKEPSRGAVARSRRKERCNNSGGTIAGSRCAQATGLPAIEPSALALALALAVGREAPWLRIEPVFAL